ncbi:MAG TPA: aminoglycoside phosphotransferase family protein [Actinomycetota bacterium]
MLDQRAADPVAAAFGLGPNPRLRGPVARGEQGLLWELITDDGRFAVKALLERTVEAEVREDAAFQDAAVAAGILAPPIRRTAEGDVLLDLDGTPVRAYGWVDLHDRDPGIDAGAVGALVASLHRLGYVGTNPTDPWYVDPVGTPRWDELVAAVRAADAAFAEPLAAYRDELVAMEALLEPPRDLITCHRDLWADNVRATPDGSLAVIDWENGGLADPSQELALVLFEYADADAHRAEALSRAYRDAGGPGHVRDRGAFAMVIAQLGHIAEWALERWLEAEEPGERDRLAALIGEVLDRPLTIAAIDQLVEAVGS